MEFTFETICDQKALTAMARGLRKTIRRKGSRRSYIFGWLVIGVTLLLLLAGGFEFSTRSVVNCLVLLILVVTMIWQDAINGYFAGKKLLPGTKTVVATFREDGYSSKTEVAATEFQYASVQAVAELPDYFVFALSKNLAQVYDKRTLSGGTLEEFRVFLEERTGREIQKVK